MELVTTAPALYPDPGSRTASRLRPDESTANEPARFSTDPYAPLESGFTPAIGPIVAVAPVPSPMIFTVGTTL